LNFEKVVVADTFGDSFVVLAAQWACWEEADDFDMKIDQGTRPLEGSWTAHNHEPDAPKAVERDAPSLVPERGRRCQFVAALAQVGGLFVFSDPVQR
jgi:hypothetical protein